MIMLIVAIVVIAGGIYLLVRITRKPAPAPPILMTKYGPVSEQWRKQAAINMLAEPDLRAQVYQIVLGECGGDDLRAEAEMHRRYPELYESE